MKATHKATGATVSGDEAVLRRLGPEWEIENKPAATKKPAAKRAAPRRKSSTK